MSGFDSSAGGPPGENAPPPAVSEDEAWAAVLEAWSDEAAHRRYLARFTDFDGLTVAGARYREVLRARPGDSIAERMRQEIVKKATVYGLAAIPRTPKPVASPTVKRLRMTLGLSVGSTIVFLVYKLVMLLGARS